MLLLGVLLIGSCAPACGITEMDVIELDSQQTCSSNIKDSVRWITNTKDSVYVEKVLIQVVDSTGNVSNEKELIREFHYHNASDSVSHNTAIVDSLMLLVTQMQMHNKETVVEKKLTTAEWLCINVLPWAVIACVILYIIDIIKGKMYDKARNIQQDN